MKRRKIHLRHPEYGPDVPFCNSLTEDRLTSDRLSEVECVMCKRWANRLMTQFDPDAMKHAYQNFLAVYQQQLEKWWESAR